MIQNVSLIYKSLKKVEMDFFSPTWSISCTNANRADLEQWKITVQNNNNPEKRKTWDPEKQQTQPESKIKPGLGKMLGSQRSDPSINSEAQEGRLPQKKSLERKLGNRDLEAGDINTILWTRFKEERQAHTPRKAKGWTTTKIIGYNLALWWLTVTQQWQYKYWLLKLN